MGKVDLDENIFGLKTFPDIIHQYIRYQNAKSRQGSHKTKTRSEVSGRSKNLFLKKVLVMQDRVVINHQILEEVPFQWVRQNRDHSFDLNKKEKKISFKICIIYKINRK